MFSKPEEDINLLAPASLVKIPKPILSGVFLTCTFFFCWLLFLSRAHTKKKNTEKLVGRYNVKVVPPARSVFRDNLLHIYVGN